MRALVSIALTLLLSTPAVADDAGPAAEDAGPAGSPLEQARALAEAGKIDEAVTSYEASLVTLADDDLASAYCEVALLLSKGDDGTQEEARARVSRYVEACLARRPRSDAAFELALKYNPGIVQQLGPEELAKREAELRKAAEGGDDDAKRNHKQVMILLVHILRITKQHDKADKMSAEFRERYDEGGDATCMLAEASFSRWTNSRENEAELDRAQELMAACLEKQPERRDMPGLYNDLLIYRYSRPVLLAGSVLLLLVAAALAFLRRKKDGEGQASTS